MVFTTLKGSYKSTVIFFRFTNLLATLQAIINNISRDLVDTSNIVAFINDVIIAIDLEKEHNELVEEILKK